MGHGVKLLIHTAISNGNSQTKISNFKYNKSGNFCLRVPPEALFYWKSLEIGIQSAMDIRNDDPIFQF